MMNKTLRNHLLNTIGIAFVATLIGMNVEYAIDNYGILTHNLSYAVLSMTGGTGGGGTGSGGTGSGGIGGDIDTSGFGDITIDPGTGDTGGDEEAIRKMLEIIEWNSLPSLGYGKYYGLGEIECWYTSKIRGVKKICKKVKPMDSNSSCRNIDETVCHPTMPL